MFGLLKSKLSGFISSLTGREEKKAAAPPQAQQAEPPQPQPAETPQATEGKMPAMQPEKQQPKPTGVPAAEKPAAIVEKQPAGQAIPVEGKKQPAILEKPPAKPPVPSTEKPAAKLPPKEPVPEKPAIPATPKPAASPTAITKPAATAEPAAIPLPAQVPGPDLSRLGKKAESEKRSMAPKIGIGSAIKSFFSSEITIGEPEVADLLEELELSLLEADVAYDVSLEVSSQLRTRLVGMKVPKGQVQQKTKEAIAGVLESVMDSERKFDFVSRVKSLPRPAKILFVGPNGAGKTTTMAKVARMLLDSGLTVVFSASDTFRAAAIEQTEVHAGRLGVKAIKSKYGSDPASVAFDAINFARANKVDVVLIDSAGRQDTNANLLSELVKINRVARPDLKLYVGESISGNAVIDQIRAFNEAIGMDGAILTKIDCDAKGGTAISIAKSTGIPVLFLGVGQGYHDLIPFDAKKLAQEIMG